MTLSGMLQTPKNRRHVWSMRENSDGCHGHYSLAVMQGWESLRLVRDEDANRRAPGRRTGMPLECPYSAEATLGWTGVFW